jgi:CRP-like cAMP-binding protein
MPHYPIKLHTAKQTAEALIAKVRAAGRSKICEAGTILYQQSDDCEGIYWLESGMIGLRKLNEDGSTMLVNLARRGDFVGYGPLLSEGEHLTSAEVLQTGRVIFVDLATATRLMRENPDLPSLLLRQATRELSSLEEKYLQIATCQAHVRLASLLLSFTDRQTTDRGETQSFQLPLLNKDLADLLGIRPETLSRAIAQLKSTGLVKLHGRSVCISDVARLGQLGHAGRPAEHRLAA